VYFEHFYGTYCALTTTPVPAPAAPATPAGPACPTATGLVA